MRTNRFSCSYTNKMSFTQTWRLHNTDWFVLYCPPENTWIRAPQRLVLTIKFQAEPICCLSLVVVVLLILRVGSAEKSVEIFLNLRWYSPTHRIHFSKNPLDVQHKLLGKKSVVHVCRFKFPVPLNNPCLIERLHFNVHPHLIVHLSFQNSRFRFKEWCFFQKK